MGGWRKPLVLEEVILSLFPCIGVCKTPNNPQHPQCACIVLHMNVLCVGGSSVAKNSTPNAKADTSESRKLRRKWLHYNLFERLPETECLH